LDASLDKLAAYGEEKEKVIETRRIMGDWWANHQAVREATDAGKKDEARNLANTKGRAIRQDAAKLVDDLVDVMKKSVAAESKQAQMRYESGRNWLFAFTFGSIVTALAFALVMLGQVRRGIERVVSVLDSSSGEVQTTSVQIATSADRLSSAATEQGASLQETSASTEELTSMVQRNLEHAKRAENVAGVCYSSAEKGQRVVADMSNAIGEIDASNQAIMAQVENSNKQIAEIVKVIREIGDKTKVINDIVFQTKLLSFNASVEAARAGEHGRGFAVVAEEVGNLAKMSGTAAKEIGDMLDGSIGKVEGIVTETRTKVEHLVKQGKAKVDTGSRIAEECGKVLHEIVAKVSEVAQMSSNIAGSSQEQALGVGEINRTIGQLDSVTHTNSSEADQAADAAKHLQVQARELKEAVGALKAIVHGDGERKTGGGNVVAAPVFAAPVAPARVEPKVSKPVVEEDALPSLDNVVDIFEKNAAKPAAKTHAAAPQATPPKKRGDGGGNSGSASGSGMGGGMTGGSSGGTPKASAQAPTENTAAPKPAAPIASAPKPLAASAPKAPPSKPPPKAVPSANSEATTVDGEKPPLKLAAGSEVVIPSEDDPRFKDV
jgi:methyl-accepting chemotaxis protein